MTPRGKISSSWEQEDGTAVLKVTIPANSTAKLYIPTEDAAGVTECGVAVSGVSGIESVESNGDTVVVKIGSGEYCFEFEF